MNESAHHPSPIIGIDFSGDDSPLTVSPKLKSKQGMPGLANVTRPSIANPSIPVTGKSFSQPGETLLYPVVKMGDVGTGVLTLTTHTSVRVGN